MAVFKLNSKNPRKSTIQKAANIIKKGGLVAFPTETVYGLGANALNAKAVKKIFVVKGRPQKNPLIVHIAKTSDMQKFAKDIPKEAFLLAKRFWPGPLTLILKKERIIPNIVTASLNSVAIRMPNNKIILQMIKTARVPIAAPSANISGRPSPTTAQHVIKDFGDKIDIILDGGKTKIGLESTVLDLTTKPPQILRPGAITKEMLEKCLRRKIGAIEKITIAKSPGMKYRHYSPKAKLILVISTIPAIIKKIRGFIKIYKKTGLKIGIMATQETKNKYEGADFVASVGSAKNPKTISRNLYSTLRRFDELNIDIILAQGFKESGLGVAIMNRLKKASSKIMKLHG